MAGNLFTRHPKDVGEGYAEHFGKAAGFGFRMIGGGIACLVHAVFPFLFVNKGSETVQSLNATLSRRVEKPNWERHPII